MLKNKLITTLTELGLTEGEASVYFASVTLGSASVLQIANAAGIKRTSTYSLLESLIAMGLMSIEVVGLKKRFVAEPPDKLESILDVRRQKLQTILPEFEALYNLQGGEGFIKYYQGVVGMHKAYDSILTDLQPRQDYMVLANEEYWYNLDPEYFEGYRQKRSKINANARLLLQDSKVAREHLKTQKNYNCTVKLLPAGVGLQTNLAIIPKKVTIHQLVQPIVTIVIETQSVVSMHREMFNLIWNSLPG